MRLLLAILLLGCGGRSEDARGAPDPDQPRLLDDQELELERNLRELAARPLPSGGSAARDRGIPLDRSTLGTQPRPFGPLSPVRGGMTRDEVLGVLSGAMRDGDRVWMPTGIEDTTAEITFDAANRVDTITYHLPLSARRALVTAWGTPVPQTNTWLERTLRWRVRLGEDAVRRKIELTFTPFTPFADLLGRGPDALADQTPIIGASLAELRARFSARLVESGAVAELSMPGATDVCSTASQLLLELANHRVKRLKLSQCYDEQDVNRRAALAAMEHHWGRGVPTRTTDDRLVYAWSLPNRRIEAEQGEDRSGVWIWSVTISAK